MGWQELAPRKIEDQNALKCRYETELSSQGINTSREIDAQRILFSYE